MAKTVIGLFTNDRDASSTMQELKGMGLGSNMTTQIRKVEPKLVERLTAAGIPTSAANQYVTAMDKGRQLVVVQGVDDQNAPKVAGAMDRHNAIELDGSQRDTGRKQANAPTNQFNGQEQVVPIIEEQLRVGKREVERGGVRVTTGVEDVAVSEQVTLRDETVDVQRREVNRPVAEGDRAMMEQKTFEVRETDEEAVVTKEARVVEEVVVSKGAQERTETVNDSVQHTTVNVDDMRGKDGRPSRDTK